MELESLFIRGTDNSPQIEFNIEHKTYIIEGKSMPENVLEFFKPIIEWLDKYDELYIVNRLINSLTVEVKLEYYNTATAKYLADIFGRFKKWTKYVERLSINWYYNEYDDVMLEDGKDLSFAVGIPMEFIEIADD